MPNCSIAGCGAEHHARGLCDMHCKRWRAGQLDRLTVQAHGRRWRADAVARFWSKVEKTDGCWLWPGSISSWGYGTFSGASGETAPAHRFAYETAYGAVPEGLDLDHVCHNADPTCPGGRCCLHRRCVPPNHLRAVPRRANVLNGRSLVATEALLTHCAHGHLFSPENTYTDTRGRRSCRACGRQPARQRYWRIRGTEVSA